MSAFRQALDLLPGVHPEPPEVPGYTDYERLLPALEAAMWAQPDAGRVAHYQAYSREMEAAVPPDIAARRHRIVVVVPVADRPRQLAVCIDSLAAWQAAYAYAGGISLLVVEDSLDPRNRAAHRDLLAGIAGLDTHYLGVDEQHALLTSLEKDLPGRIFPFVGDDWRREMGHKGASVTRNIAMLWLSAQAIERPLFHFIDSDQAFHVDVGAEHPRYMLNYYHHLDRLFRMHDISVLTGKVVGDPPVSPAVMAGTLLADVIRIAEEAAPRDAAACGFHGDAPPLEHGAYHDMASMFGLDNRADAWRYACPLEGPHSYADALDELGGRLLHFFDGEHPTRLTPFSYQPVEESLAPARTVYTGNYVMNSEGLGHAIPFAPMKLRMAGPTLGRLLQASLGERFVQAHLPLLHQRIESGSGRSEFRPGVSRQAGQVDLSGEYERQFLGDWVLFSVAELVAQGYPADVGAEGIARALERAEQCLLDGYAETRRRVMQRLERLRELLDSPAMPWQGGQAMRSAEAKLRAFLESVQRNFAAESPAVVRLSDTAFRGLWKQRLGTALLGFDAATREWERLLESRRDAAAWER